MCVCVWEGAALLTAVVGAATTAGAAAVYSATCVLCCIHIEHERSAPRLALVSLTAGASATTTAGAGVNHSCRC